MPRPCAVCVHPQRPEIDAALITGRDTFRNLAERYGTSATALHRHKKQHMPVSLTKARQVREVAQADDLLGQVQELQRRTIVILERAEEAGDLRTALQAVREARGNLELLAKMVAAAVLLERTGTDDAHQADGEEWTSEKIVAELTRLAGGPWPAADLLMPTDDELPPGFRPSGR